MIKTFLLTLSIALLALTSGFSQKYGYINSTQLLVNMPQVKSADSQLEDYRKQLFSKGETMGQTLQQEYQVYAQQAQQGQLTGVAMQEKEAYFRNKQLEIQQYEAEVQQLMMKKREELYRPIQEKVKAAVEEIGKQGGYTMIFDQAVAGAIVFGSESDNILDQVKAKLGIQ